MATIKYLLQSKSESSNIYVRFSIDRLTAPKRKTGFIVNPKDWSATKSQPITKNEDLKSLKFKLDKLGLFIETAFNQSVNKGIEINGDWLQQQIDVFNKKVALVDLDILSNYIEKYINDAPYKQNQKKELGLSESRIKAFENFKNMILRFEKEQFNSKKITISQVDIPFSDVFKKWLIEQEYSINYAGKNIDNLKSICFDAEKNGIEVSPQLKNIKSMSVNKVAEDIIYLSPEEQSLIKNATIEREALKNTRKWLLLGCLLGQRGGDLLSITDKNIIENNGRKIIELKQMKTGKLVAIPLLPDALDIIKDGFPYKISASKFNEYLKDLCEISKINTPTTGRVKTQQRGSTIMKTLPKHDFISSHVCRRSFATNYYGRIPTPLLMSITGHGTEKMFLKYIGKTSYDNAIQMLDYFDKIASTNK